MEEKKNIAITLQEAKEWYKGKNPTLKKLALKAFSKEELEKQNELPKTWEEFCERTPVKKGECHITNLSMINILSEGVSRDVSFDKNICTSEQEAEAHLALNQLRQLRKAYVKDWEPNWNNNKQYKACIMYNGTDFIIAYFKDLCSRPLSFPTIELATQFLTNFRNLIEIAKPLM